MNFSVWLLLDWVASESGFFNLQISDWATNSVTKNNSRQWVVKSYIGVVIIHLSKWPYLTATKAENIEAEIPACTEFDRRSCLFLRTSNSRKIYREKINLKSSSVFIRRLFQRNFSIIPYSFRRRSFSGFEKLSKSNKYYLFEVVSLRYKSMIIFLLYSGSFSCLFHSIHWRNWMTQSFLWKTPFVFQNPSTSYSFD